MEQISGNHFEKEVSVQTSTTAITASTSLFSPNDIYYYQPVVLAQVVQPSYHAYTQTANNGIATGQIDAIQLTANQEVAAEESLQIPDSSWRRREPENKLLRDISVTYYGTIFIRLSDTITANLTIDKAIRVNSLNTNTTVSIGATGSQAALFHPMGRVYQYGSRVEIIANDKINNNNKYAKMWYKGINFTSDKSSLVYLMDAGGVRTTTDKFFELKEDISLDVFYNESRYGRQYIEDAQALVHASKGWISRNGTKTFIINGIRISHKISGTLCVARDFNKYSIKLTPGNNSAMLHTNFLHATASLEGADKQHLFARRGERRIYFDGASFIVRNAGNSARLVRNSCLKMY